MHAKSLQWCLTLYNPMDCSPPGSFVHGILQVKLLEWLPSPSPEDFPSPRIKLTSLISPALTGRFFTTSTTWETQSYLQDFAKYFSQEEMIQTCYIIVLFTRSRAALGDMLDQVLRLEVLN